MDKKSKTRFCDESQSGSKDSSENSERESCHNLESPPVENPLVIAIGASAGGVEALEVLFSQMPNDLDAAFVVVQHLSSEHESLMPQILARKTDLPIKAIENDAILLAGHVYVLPSGWNVQVHQGKFVLDNLSDDRPSLPINLLFESVAVEYRDRAVAIVLSGTGTDGSEGVKCIRQHGGMVIVQNEQSAKFNGMPRAAISTGVADAITSLEEIPDTLTTYARIEPNGTSRRLQFLAEQDVDHQIRLLLHNHFQIDFELYKTSMTDRRIRRRMELVGVFDKESYLEKIIDDSAELQELCFDLLIGVTEFFRDSDAFMELKNRVLPDLIEEVDGNELRIWVCPCSTGEEAYSIAMLVDQLLKTSGSNVDFKVFATDVNQKVIDFASQGIYSESQLENVNSNLLETYFEKMGDQYLIDRELRKRVVFAKHDVLQDAPFTKLDMICCRNLLIYFKPEAQRKALSLFNFGLRNEGILFLGPSESITGLESKFESLCDRSNIHKKVSTVRISQLEHGVVASKGKSSQLLASYGSPSAQINEENLSLARTYDSLLEQFVPTGFLVDDKDRVLHIFGNVSGFFQVTSGRTTGNLLDMLPPNISKTVSSGLKQIQLVSSNQVRLSVDADPDNLQVVVQSVANDPLNRRLVSIEKADSQEYDCKAMTPTHLSSGLLGEFAGREELERKLRETEQLLSESVLNLKSLNEELQSTNEELIASNEELQSTNEELRSVNEELCSVNSEHQRKIAELMELTDDMDNLLDSMQVDTIFLDSELRIRKFTLGLARIFDLVPHDVGRRFDRLVHGLKNISLVEEIKNVLDSRKRLEKEVQCENDNWYLLRVLPYTTGDAAEGVLLTLIDIDWIKQTEFKLSELSDIVLYSDDAIFKATPEGLIKTWNQGAETLFQLSPNSIVGKHLSDLGLEDRDKQKMQAAMDQINKGTRTDHLELKAVCEGGDPVEVQMAASPIFDAEKKVISASIVIRNFSKQKQAEFLNRQAVRQRDQFLAMLSHELRNPIAAIMSALGVLKISNDTEDHEEARITIERHSKQLSNLLDDLLDVSRITHDKIKLHLRPVDFVNLTNEAIECVNGRVLDRNQILSIELPHQSLFVYADPTRILQALVNLLVNATKYTPAGGHIRVSVYEADDLAVLEVEDDGVGIEPELLDNIFEIFVQAEQPLDRQSGGMGLGLPLVKMIAKAHGGAVEARSKGSGCGSNFRFQVPALANVDGAVVESNDAPHVKSEVNIENLQVLLVEDNPSTRKMVKIFLECNGISVLDASNGLEGIEMFKAHRPDVCVVDIGLPDCNGFEVAKQIRKSDGQSTALIALTGYGLPKDKELSLEAGFDFHLVKPIDPDDLVKVITEIVRFNTVVT